MRATGGNQMLAKTSAKTAATVEGTSPVAPRRSGTRHPCMAPNANVTKSRHRRAKARVSRQSVVHIANVTMTRHRRAKARARQSECSPQRSIHRTAMSPPAEREGVAPRAGQSGGIRNQEQCPQTNRHRFTIGVEAPVREGGRRQKSA